jgi:hypothetical protein
MLPIEKTSPESGRKTGGNSRAQEEMETVQFAMLRTERPKSLLWLWQKVSQR